MHRPPSEVPHPHCRTITDCRSLEGSTSHPIGSKTQLSNQSNRPRDPLFSRAGTSLGLGYLAPRALGKMMLALSHSNQTISTVLMILGPGGRPWRSDRETGPTDKMVDFGEADTPSAR